MSDKNPRRKKGGLVGKILSNTFFSFTSRLIGVAIAILSIRFLSGHLGPAGYGDYNTALAYIFLFSTIADFGLYSWLLKELGAAKTDQHSDRVSEAISLRGFTVLTTVILAFGASFFLPLSYELKIGIALAASGFIFLSLAQVLIPVFQKHFLMAWAGGIEVITRLAHLAGIIILVELNAGIISFLSLFALVGLLNFFLMSLAAYRRVPFRLNLNFTRWRAIIRETYPIALGLIFTMTYFKIDTVMLALIKGSTEVGWYNLSYRILESLIFFPAAFVGLITPLLAGALTNRPVFKKIFLQSFKVLVVGTIPFVIGIFVLAPEIINVFDEYNKFSPSILILQILAVAIGFIYLATLFGQSVIVLARQKRAVWIYGLGALINVSVNLVVIPRYGALGAAWSTVLTEALVLLGLILIVTQALRWFPGVGILAKSGAAGVIMLLTLLILNDEEVMVRLLVAVAAYSLGVTLFKVISWPELYKLARGQFGSAS